MFRNSRVSKEYSPSAYTIGNCKKMSPSFASITIILFHFSRTSITDQKHTHAAYSTTYGPSRFCCCQISIFYGPNFSHLRSEVTRFFTQIAGFTMVSNTPDREFIWGLPGAPHESFVLLFIYVCCGATTTRFFALRVHISNVTS